LEQVVRPVDPSGAASYGAAVESFCQECSCWLITTLGGGGFFDSMYPEKTTSRCAAYCPECAEREFELIRRVDSGRTEN
jgi:hypothetical protein